MANAKKKALQKAKTPFEKKDPRYYSEHYKGHAPGHEMEAYLNGKYNADTNVCKECGFKGKHTHKGK
ncbi:MAG: hypothetical protein V4436_03550 [Patescibacteria group bacterium]